ncbi:c-type cytochrome [Aromatoleum petrolei]|uniref:Cytochrome c n=1 Tax=Aromatoleum petrolei TaxID=76116 RepID=A0ABX1MJ68_9RHOO|nr:cytochrome c [Aromatoleum petrolei]NMF87995.1 cytochrome c [Aromatoleum petrolei]QTQ36634.1 Cytochrome c [Aromatoleum petrolei]
MKKLLTHAAAGLVALSLAGIASAQMKPEDAIKNRQSGYTFMAWNMGKIKAQVVDGTTPYNKDQVVAAANVIAATANSGMGALYLPGTDKGKGWKDTRLKAEFFKEQEEVGKIAKNFIEQANTLQKVAMTGDQAAIKAQFGEMGKACKACHDKYRVEE